jgi:hypothetical protein
MPTHKSLNWPSLDRRPWYRRLWARIRSGVRRAAVAVLWIGILGGIAYAVYTRPRSTDPARIVHTPTIPERVILGNPLWHRPSAAPNGTQWPGESGYIAGFPRLNVGGLADVTVENSGGASDLFAKLIDRGQTPAVAVRVFLVKAGDKLTLHRVKPGHYDVRYMSLDSGLIRRTPDFEVTLTKTARGEQYQGWTVPVYEVIDGTIHHEEIDSREF